MEEIDLGEPEMVRCPVCGKDFEALSGDLGSYKHRDPQCLMRKSEGVRKPVKILDVAMKKLEREMR